MVLAVGATAEVVMMAAAVYCRSRRRGGRQPVGGADCAGEPKTADLGRLE